MSKSQEDGELVRRAAAKDKEAFRLLYERYGQRAYGIAFEVVRRKEDAEDIVQESFVKAYLSLPEFRGQSSFYTWLYRIVYNLAIDYKRRINRRGGETLEYDEIKHKNDTVAVAEPVVGPHEAVVRKERAERIQNELAHISEEHRMVIILREVDGLNYEEIADVLKISKGTVMSRLHYARKRLQKALKDVAQEANLSLDQIDSEQEPLDAVNRRGLSVSRNSL